MQKKSDLKHATDFDTLQLAKRDDLANLKSDVDKLKSVPVDLGKLRNLLNNDVVKKDVYNTDEISSDKKIEDAAKKTDVSKLVTKSALYTKIGEVENKIPNINRLVTKSV